MSSDPFTYAARRPATDGETATAALSHFLDAISRYAPQVLEELKVSVYPQYKSYLSGLATIAEFRSAVARWAVAWRLSETEDSFHAFGESLFSRVTRTLHCWCYFPADLEMPLRFHDPVSMFLPEKEFWIEFRKYVDPFTIVDRSKEGIRTFRRALVKEANAAVTARFNEILEIERRRRQPQKIALNHYEWAVCYQILEQKPSEFAPRVLRQTVMAGVNSVLVLLGFKARLNSEEADSLENGPTQD